MPASRLPMGRRRIPELLVIVLFYRLYPHSSRGNSRGGFGRYCWFKDVLWRAKVAISNICLYIFFTLCLVTVVEAWWGAKRALSCAQPDDQTRDQGSVGRPFPATPTMLLVRHQIHVYMFIYKYNKEAKDYVYIVKTC